MTYEIQEAALPAWEAMPDFGLYMDQVVTYVDRCFAGAPVESLTPGMINSYVKVGIVDRPRGKKYSRDSIAQLLMVCCLKQTTPLDTLSRLLHPADGATAETLWSQFLAARSRVLQTVIAREGMTALDCALEAAMYQTLCRQLLAAGQEEE